METRSFVWGFSPNQTSPEVLEKIFVQRHRLAEVWTDLLCDSMLTGAKHHLLAVGPRGSGKSHLVALLVRRLRAQDEINRQMRVAWLREDDTTPSFWKFLLRILRALNAEYEDEFPPFPPANLDARGDYERIAELTKYLLEKLGDRKLLLVVENLGDVLSGLKFEGQKRWRAFLHEHPVTAILATAPQLTEDFSSRTRPFFNFFRIEHLAPLSTDEALALLKKLADYTENTALSEFLQTETSRARVRAICHLVGGNQRLFILLAKFATNEKLDDLVGPFEELLDKLTPYYQDRLRILPSQQREIVEFLSRQTQTVSVKEIAEALFISEQTAAAQLKSLKGKAYVSSNSVGRESRYELSEPLMRLCVEVKDIQRKPIRLIVTLLQMWYEQDEIEARFQRLPEDAVMDRAYLDAAMRRDSPSQADQIEQALQRDLAAARRKGDANETARALLDAAHYTRSAKDCLAACMALHELDRFAEALDASERAIELAPMSATAWNTKSYVLSSLNRVSESLAACERAIEVDAGHAAAWNMKGFLLNKLGRYAEALSVYDHAIGLDSTNVFAWRNRARAKLGLGRVGDAIEDCRRAISLEPDFATGFEVLAEALIQSGDWREARRTLVERFQLPVSKFNPPKISHLPDVVAAIFRATGSRQRWAERVDQLASIKQGVRVEHKKRRLEGAAAIKKSDGRPPLLPDPLVQLADALVRSLTNPVYLEATEEALRQWVDVWREVAETKPELSLAVRVFVVGLRYARTKDERVLLDLVTEERRLLYDLFRMENPTR